MDVDNVSFDFVRAYPIVSARLERANLPWLIYLFQMSCEFLLSAECLGTMTTAESGFARTWRVNAPGSIDGMDSEVCGVCGFQW